MQTIGIALYKLLDLISFMILIQCIMSWFPGGTKNKIYEILSNLVDPIVDPVRSLMYSYTSGPIDFSPMIVIFILMFLKKIILSAFIY